MIVWQYDSMIVWQYDSGDEGGSAAPGVAGAQGGKVPNFASLSIANNRQPTTTNDIQIFRR